MIPVRLQIRGFLSYHDPVEIDFSGFDMACISGSNGAGKSSLLDAITWALFGEARRRDDAVINHRTQKEDKPTEVVLDFDYNNVRYRVQRILQKEKVTTQHKEGKDKKDAVKRKIERDKISTLDFYQQSEDGGWIPLTEATMRATEERIRQTLRLDYETFISTSFFLQGKADQFAQQKPADRKRILAAILGLEDWDNYKEETLRQRRSAEMELANCEGSLAEINTELKEEAERKARLKALEKDYETRNELVQANKKILDQQRLIAGSLESDKAQLEKQSAEIARLHAELDQKVDDLLNRQEEQRQFRLQIEHEEDIRAGHEDWLKQQKRLGELDAVAANFHQYESKRQAPLLKMEGERAKLQAEINNLTAKASEVTALEPRLEALKSQAEECRQAIEQCETQLQMRPVLEKDLLEIQNEKARAKAENAVLKAEMDELETRRKALREVSGSTCPTCEKPLEAQERQRIIDDLTTRGTQKAEIYRKNLKSIEQCDALFRDKETELASLQRVEADLKLQQRLFDSKSEELKRSQTEIEGWHDGGARQLAAARLSLQQEDFAVEARNELSAIDEELMKLGYDATAHEKVRVAELAGREYQQKKELLDQAKSALKPLEREIAGLEKAISAAESHLQTLEREFQAANEKYAASSAAAPNIAELERSHRDAQEELNKLLTEVGYARNQVDVLKNLKTQQAAREEDKEGILRQIAQLKMLERAFGKDGIPALLIEQALPEIEEHANEILDRLTSGEMSLSFRTQRRYRDENREDRKETLDIMVSSSAEEREYELFSGGEAFRINFAVRLALSRVLANRAGARLQTLVIDEGFGSQDAEGRQRLIEAINFVHPEFARIIVITHLEELKDAFSARIEVSKGPGGSQVQVVAA